MTRMQMSTTKDVLTGDTLYVIIVDEWLWTFKAGVCG